MTVKELNMVLDSGENIILVYAGHKEKLNRYDNSFQMIAYGDYIIDCISTSKDGVEADIKLIPAKG